MRKERLDLAMFADAGAVLGTMLDDASEARTKGQTSWPWLHLDYSQLKAG